MRNGMMLLQKNERQTLRHLELTVSLARPGRGRDGDVGEAEPLIGDDLVVGNRGGSVCGECLKKYLRH